MNSYLNYYTITSFLAALTSGFLFWYMVTREVKSKPIMSMAFLVGSMFLWFVPSVFVAGNFFSESTEVLGWKIILLGVMGTGFVSYYAVRINLSIRIHHIVNYISVFVFLVWGYFLIVTNHVVDGVYFRSGSFVDYQHGDVFGVFAAFLVFLFLLSYFTSLYQFFKSDVRVTAKRAEMILIAFCLPIILGLMSALVLPSLGVDAPRIVGALLIPSFIVIFYYVYRGHVYGNKKLFFDIRDQVLIGFVLLSLVPFVISNYWIYQFLNDILLNNPEVDTSIIGNLRALTSGLGILFSILIILFAKIFSDYVTSPIHELISATKRIEKGEYDSQLEVSGGWEFQLLGSAFNKMSGAVYEMKTSVDKQIYEQTRKLSKNSEKLEKQRGAILSVLKDVEKERRKAIREEAKDEALLQSIGEGVVATDSSGTVVFSNSSAHKILGYTAEEFLGKKWGSNFPDIVDRKGDKIPIDDLPFSKSHNRKEKSSGQLYYKCNDSSVVAVSETASPVLIDEEYIGSIVVFRDITKEMNIDEMKTDFISLASHQLRTPLSAMRWFSEMLLMGKMGDLTDEQKETIQNIYDSNMRMIDLVGALLNISRIESGRIIIDPEPTDLKDLVEDIVVELKPRIDEKKQNLGVTVHSGLGKINIDPKLIRNVYMNLMTNAIKYSPEGGDIQVAISKKDGKVISQVSDTGVGIPKSQHGRIFEKFFRADNVVRKETDGNGLGLYLVKAVVESSGGEIWFESEENKGTTFWFSLPLSGSKPKEGEVTIDS